MCLIFQKQKLVYLKMVFPSTPVQKYSEISRTNIVLLIELKLFCDLKLFWAWGCSE